MSYEKEISTLRVEKILFVLAVLYFFTKFIANWNCTCKLVNMLILKNLFKRWENRLLNPVFRWPHYCLGLLIFLLKQNAWLISFCFHCLQTGKLGKLLSLFLRFPERPPLTSASPTITTPLHTTTLPISPEEQGQSLCPKWKTSNYANVRGCLL